MNRRKGTRDAFKNLMQLFPDVARLIEQLALSRRKYPITHIHQELLWELHPQKGLTSDDYPFCCKNNGYRGLTNFIKKLRSMEKQARQRRVPARLTFSPPSPGMIVMDRGELISHNPELMINEILECISKGGHAQKPKKLKRLGRNQRLPLAIAIRDAALTMLERDGKKEKIDGYQCVTYEKDGIRIIHITPFSQCPGAPGPYGLDIWAGGRKVFNFIWDPNEIICFKYGPWTNRFVPGSYLVGT